MTPAAPFFLLRALALAGRRVASSRRRVQRCRLLLEQRPDHFGRPLPVRNTSRQGRSSVGFSGWLPVNCPQAGVRSGHRPGGQCRPSRSRLRTSRRVRRRNRAWRRAGVAASSVVQAWVASSRSACAVPSWAAYSRSRLDQHVAVADRREWLRRDGCRGSWSGGRPRTTAAENARRLLAWLKCCESLSCHQCPAMWRPISVRSASLARASWMNSPWNITTRRSESSSN